MATAHLLHGYLGVGKTTFARRLERERPVVRYTPDEWMARLFGIDPPEAKFADYREAIYDVMHGHWPQVLKCGTDVVLDFGFWTRAQRDQARTWAAAAGASTRLYRLTCSESTAQARCQTRNANLDGSLIIAENTYDVLRVHFQPLEPDEVFEIVDSESV